MHAVERCEIREMEGADEYDGPQIVGLVSNI